MTSRRQNGNWISAIGLQANNLALALAVVFLNALVATPLAQAQFKTLYTFTGGADGGHPQAAVIRDATGNIYGTTLNGGNLNCNSPLGCGVAYKLTPVGKEIVLHPFSGGKDGAYPAGALIMDQAGNLYGTTSSGGISGCFQGCGTVFKIDAKRKYSVLHRFTGGKDGGGPSSALVMDTAGNFYGTAGFGGDPTCSCGVVYKMTATGKITVLYAFTGGAAGGFPAVDTLAMDLKGNLYGTAGGGDPTCNCGVVFKLTKGRKQTVLHTFVGGTTDGSFPSSGVTLFKGVLYGTAPLGGSNNKGILYKITNASGTEHPAATFSLLHSFGSGTDGATPGATVSFGAKGNLYGTTELGGTLGTGTLYKVDTTGKESVLYSFNYSLDGGVSLAPTTIIKGGAPDITRVETLTIEAEGGTIKGGFGVGAVGRWSGH